MISRGWQVTAILLVWLAGMVWGAYTGYSWTDAWWSKEWALRDKADAKALAQREAAERTEEQRRQQAITRITENAQQQITAARADADSAAAAGERLHETAEKLQQQLRASEASRDIAITDASKARREAEDLRSQLFRESDEMAGAFAAEADRAYIAGRACEQAYDSLIQSQ